MRRRELIGALAASIATGTFAARAQQPLPKVGFLRNTSSGDSATLVAAFRQGLRETGYIENESVAIEYRWADNQNNRMPALAAELVHRPVAVILAGGNPAAFAAKAATQTIPIVFAIGNDPVELGMVASLNQPGGNMTGVTFLSTSSFLAKRLELLSQVVPVGAVIAFLGNPKTPNGLEEIHAMQAAARSGRREVPIVNAANPSDLDLAFAKLADQHAGGLIVGGDSLFLSRRGQLVALAARYRIPTSYQLRPYAAAGGLMSYGASIADAYRQAGTYVGRILKGEKPGDLPVVLPTKFDLVINLKTAKALGVTIPPNLLALADEVIE